MEQAIKKVLLIYQYGSNSDIAFNGEKLFPRGQNFRDHMNILNGLPDLKSMVITIQNQEEPLQTELDFTNYDAEQRKVQHTQGGKSEPIDFIINTMQFNIIPDVLKYIIDELKQVNNQNIYEIHFLPIATDQNPPHHQDTVELSPLVGIYFHFINKALENTCKTVLLNSFNVKVNVSRYDEVLNCYSDLQKRIQDIIEKYDKAYFSIGTGTPQMSASAGWILASEPRIQLIYKPWTGDTGDQTKDDDKIIKIDVFRNRLQSDTLKRLNDLLDRFDFTGSLEVVKDPRNGFTLDEKQESKRIFQALSAWQNYDFEEAAKTIPVSDEITKKFKELCECLSKENPKDEDKAEFWKTKIADTVMRLELAVYRHDLPAVLDHFYNYNEVCLNWGINLRFPDVNPSSFNKTNEDIKRLLNNYKVNKLYDEQGLKNETVKYCILFLLSENNESANNFQKWFSIHKILRKFKDDEVDNIRNQLIHASVQLQEKLFDDIFLKIKKDINLPNGYGPWLLLGLTYWSFSSLPNTDQSNTIMIRELASRSWNILARYTDNIQLLSFPNTWEDKIKQTKETLIQVKKILNDKGSKWKPTKNNKSNIMQSARIKSKQGK